MLTETDTLVAQKQPSGATSRARQFSRRERVWLALTLVLILAYGANLEMRTALRRTPMTDLGVFACAAGAVQSGANLYTICDWHGWHYVYPPALAIVFLPLQHPVPVAPTIIPGVTRTADNTPWGYAIDSHRQFYGLDEHNLRFFFIVAVWYLISVALIWLASHALACALEDRRFSDPPPLDRRERRRWWALRGFPLLMCAGSLLTDLSRGQTDILMMAALSFALYLTAVGKSFRAGLWFSVPASLKLFPGMALIYPIWRRRWRMMAGAIVGLLLALVVLPAVTWGPARSVSLYKSWVQILALPALGKGADASLIHELTGMESTDNQSLLAFVHNWRYHDLARGQRPSTAAPVERYAVYTVGGVLLGAACWVFGARKDDSPRDLLTIAGLLTGLALTISPVTHNYYFVLLLPLIAALLHRRLDEGGAGFLIVLVTFAAIDIAARLPKIGPWLRDDGLPLLSVLMMLAAGAVLLLRRNSCDDHPKIITPAVPHFAE